MIPSEVGYCTFGDDILERSSNLLQDNRIIFANDSTKSMLKTVSKMSKYNERVM